MARVESKTVAVLREMARAQPLSLVVSGESMSPLLTHGARVEVTASRWVWPGDAIVFHDSTGHLVAHRVVGYLPWKWRLCVVAQGDRMPSPDGPVPLNRIVGRVSGGDCSPRLVRVPVDDRLRALVRFLRLPLRRMAQSG